MTHLLIFRTGGSIIDFRTYNCQEIGLAKALSEKCMKVTVVMAGNDYSQHRIAPNVELYYLPISAINQQLCVFKGWKQLLSSLHPDIIQIHEFGMWMSYQVTKWAKKRHIPICLIQGSYQTTQKPIYKQMEKLFNHTFGQYVLKHVDGVGYKSKMAARYINHYVHRESMPTYIGLDESKFEHAEDCPAVTRKDWKNKHVLTYVGIMEERRNPHFLLNLIKTLPSNYVLLMAGNGPLLPAIKKRVIDEHLQTKVHILGKLRQEELPCLYKQSDLFLLASNYEIYGMVILEAMYFGTPVISTPTAGAEIIISHMEDGIVAKMDESNWIQHIRAICETPKLKERMSRAAIQKIQKELIWAKACNKFVELYNQIIKRNQP